MTVADALEFISRCLSCSRPLQNDPDAVIVELEPEKSAPLCGECAKRIARELPS